MTQPVGVERVFESPSKMKQFDQCQLLGQLTYIDRWEPREAHISLVPRLRGNGFSKACHLIHQALIDKTPEKLDDIAFTEQVVAEAVSLFDRQYKYCLERGVNFKPDTDALARAELRRVIPLYMKYTPLRRHWTVTAAEFQIPTHRCRPDLAGLTPVQMHFVGDMKYKSSLEVRYESDTIEEFHWDFQFQQYPHGYRRLHHIEPGVPVYSYLFLVIGSPFRIREVGWLYTPEQQQIWEESAKDLTQTIRLITEDGKLPRASTSHRSRFGWCPMKKACLEYYLDPELMKRDYIQLLDLPE